MTDVMSTKNGAATNDVNGKLYCFLQRTLRSFYRRLGDLKVEFTLLNVDVKDLARFVPEQKFARIEVRP